MAFSRFRELKIGTAVVSGEQRGVRAAFARVSLGGGLLGDESLRGWGVELWSGDGRCGGCCLFGWGAVIEYYGATGVGLD